MVFIASRCDLSGGEEVTAAAMKQTASMERLGVMMAGGLVAPMSPPLGADEPAQLNSTTSTNIAAGLVGGAASIATTPTTVHFQQTTVASSGHSSNNQMLHLGGIHTPSAPIATTTLLAHSQQQHCHQSKQKHYHQELHLQQLSTPVSPQRSPVSPHPPLLRGDLSMLLRGGTSSGISPSGTSPAGTDATQQDQFQQQHGRMQRSRSSRGTRNGGANNAGGGSQSPRGGATFSSSHKGQSYQQQSFPFPQLNSLPTAGSTTINNIIASPTASAAATAASNTSTTITTTNVTSFLLQQASTKLMGSGGGGGAGTMMEQVPGENVVGGGISSGRGQRYSIDYTTLTEMDRMRVMQQVNSLRQRLGDGWSRKGADLWGTSGTGCPASPGGLHKGPSTRRHRRSASRGSFRQQQMASSNQQQQQQQNTGKRGNSPQACISSPVLSYRTPMGNASSLTLNTSSGSLLQLLDPTLNNQHKSPSPAHSHANSPQSLSPLGHHHNQHRLSASHTASLHNNIVGNQQLQHHRSVGRSQSVRTAKRPQTLENSTRFRQRIASIPGERGSAGCVGEWDSSGIEPATSGHLGHAAWNASSANSVYGGDGYDGSGLGIEAAAAAAAAAGAGGGEVQRLRNFAVTSKGVINRGDSFRSKANNSRSLQASAKVGVRSVSLHRQHASSLNRLNVPTGGTGSQRQRSHSGGSQNCIHATNQSGSNPELHTDASVEREAYATLAQVSPTIALRAVSLSDGGRVLSQLEESGGALVACNVFASHIIQQESLIDAAGASKECRPHDDDELNPAEADESIVDDVICVEPTAARRYRVLVLGAPETGKTSLTRQFTTSEYICSYDSSMDEEHEKVVQIILNGEESELVFIEHKSSEALRNPVTSYQPDAYLVVYSMTSKSSFGAAKEFLQTIRKWDNMAARAVILVANKTDLVRLRAISTSEGRSFASGEGIKFIETSAGINHNVDELLAGLLHQIRLKQQLLIKRSASQRSQGTTLKILPLMRTRTSPVMQNGSLNQTPGDLPGDCHGATHKRPLRAKMFLKKILRKACGTFSGAAHSSCDNLHVL
ncbi:uncharacterized protein LOC111243793 isoform X2 [Varroa destructor]|uniref:Uncharacterized protein n=1 Tax=Varroa destructor TaxID=109461 RepID=A0A7M7J204_VARDE|nr:uncharacterized protein LOC111243793 isoform X2 [Varroa destructor]